MMPVLSSKRQEINYSLSLSIYLLALVIQHLSLTSYLLPMPLILTIYLQKERATTGRPEFSVSPCRRACHAVALAKAGHRVSTLVLQGYLLETQPDARPHE
jgi:hypothetical protein